MAKKQQTSNVSHLIRWFCKFLANKLPSISWKTDSTEKRDDKPVSPVKVKPTNISQLNQLGNQSDQPDVVPMVHLIIPVRQRCHSTTADF